MDPMFQEMPSLGLNRTRQSLSALNDPNNSHLLPHLPRSFSDDVAAGKAAGMTGKDALKRRAASIGGQAVTGDPSLKALSPRSFRRAQKPRKSILKMAVSNNSPLKTNKSPSRSPKAASPRGSLIQTTPSKPSVRKAFSPSRSPANAFAHTIDFSSLQAGNKENESRGDDSVMFNNIDGFVGGGQDHTMPALRHGQARMSLSSTMGMTDKEKAKAARRAYLATRKSVSFASHAQVRMFDSIVADGTPSAESRAKSAMNNAAKHNKGFDFAAGNSQGTVFGSDAGTSSKRRSSSRRHGRQTSITSIAEIAPLSQPAPVVETNAPAPTTRRMSAAASENGDESAMSMDIETDSEEQESVEGEETMDVDNQTMDFTAVSAFNFNVTPGSDDHLESQGNTESIFSSAPATTDIPRFSVRRNLFDSPQAIGGASYSVFSSNLALQGDDYAGQDIDTNNHTGTTSIFSAPPAKEPANRSRLSIADDVTMDMDITEVVAGGTLQGMGSPTSTITAPSDDGEDDEDDESDDNESYQGGQQEDRTMDFTVAVGGIIPTQPPMDAWRHEGSIGYSAPQQQIEAPTVTPVAPPSPMPHSPLVQAVIADSRVELSPSPPPPTMPMVTEDIQVEAILRSPPRAPEQLFSSRRASSVDKAQEDRPRTPNKRYSVLGAPERSPHKNLAPPRSPAKALFSPGAKASTRPTTPSRLAAGITTPAPQPDWAQQEFANITFGNFLEMTGIHFMTSMPTATRRKSVLNGGMPAEYMQRMMNGDSHGYPLHEYSAAMNAWFHYKMYHWACQQMQQDIETTQDTLDEMHRDASVDNPMIVREYLAASDEEKGLFEEMLQNLKTNARLIAKEKWYEWRLQLTAGVQQQIQAMNVSLKEDNGRIDTIRTEASRSLELLRERKMELQKALIQEKASIEAVTECDQIELRELKTAITEQSAQIASFAAEYNEQNEKLGQLKLKLEEHQTQKQVITSALAAAKRECEQRKGFTKSEAFELEQELKALQSFHCWTVEELTESSLKLKYDDDLRLTASCSDYEPNVASCTLTLASSHSLDSSTLSLFQLVKPVFESSKTAHQFPALLQQLAQLWTAAQKLRSEFKLVGLRYPTTYAFDSTQKRFESRSNILLKTSRSRVQVSFGLDQALLCGLPDSLGQIDVECTKVYGSVDVDDLTDLIRERIGSATAEACLMAFSQSCCDLESL